LSFIGIDVDNNVDVGFHVGADVPDLPDLINRNDRVGGTPAGACPL
jgi:hypothetical protein